VDTGREGGGLRHGCWAMDALVCKCSRLSHFRIFRTLMRKIVRKIDCQVRKSIQLSGPPTPNPPPEALLGATLFGPILLHSIYSMPSIQRTKQYEFVLV